MNRYYTQMPFVNGCKHEVTSFLDEFCRGDYLIGPPDRHELELLFAKHSVRYGSLVCDAATADNRAKNLKKQFKGWCALEDDLNASYILCISTSPNHPLIMEEMFVVQKIIEGIRGEISFYVKTDSILGFQIRIDVISYK